MYLTEQQITNPPLSKYDYGLYQFYKKECFRSLGDFPPVLKREDRISEANGNENKVSYTSNNINNNNCYGNKREPKFHGDYRYTLELHSENVNNDVNIKCTSEQGRLVSVAQSYQMIPHKTTSPYQNDHSKLVSKPKKKHDIESILSNTSGSKFDTRLERKIKNDLNDFDARSFQINSQITNVSNPVFHGIEVNNDLLMQPAGLEGLMSLAKVANEQLGKEIAKEKRRSKSNNSLHLWEFLLNLLESEEYLPSSEKSIEWTNKSIGEFRLLKTSVIASLWGKSKNRDTMTYEKMARAMRYYYKMKVLVKVPHKRLHFQFGPKLNLSFNLNHLRGENRHETVIRHSIPGHENNKVDGLSPKPYNEESFSDDVFSFPSPVTTNKDLFRPYVPNLNISSNIVSEINRRRISTEPLTPSDFESESASSHTSVSDDTASENFDSEEIIEYSR